MTTGAGQPERATPSPRKLAGIEALRVVACVSIVVFHADTSRWPNAVWGLFAFAAATVALAVRSAKRRGHGDFLRARARTLLLPWAAWWVAYAALVFAVTGGKTAEAMTPASILSGPGRFLHLWFFPYAFVVSLLAGIACARLTPRGERVAGIGAAVAACAGALAIAAWGAAESLTPPLWQWLATAPAAVFGVTLASARREAGPITPPLLTEIVALMLGAWFALRHTGLLTAPPAYYTIALAAVWAAWSWSKPAPRWLARAGSLTLGVFLVHPAVMLVYYKAAQTLGWTDDALPRAAAVAFVSFALVWVLKRTPARALV